VRLLQLTPLEDIGISMTSFDLLTSIDTKTFEPRGRILLDFEIYGVMNKPGKCNCAANLQATANTIQ